MALSFSRVVSIMLLGIYFLYLFFQFRSHPHLFYSHSSGTPFPSNASNRVDYDPHQDEVYSDEESHPVSSDTAAIGVIFPSQADQSPCPHTQLPAPADIHAGQGLPMVNIDTVERGNSAPSLWNSCQNYDISGYSDDHHCRNFVLANRAISLGLLVSSTFLIAVCAEFFASSFETLNDQNILGESFVGLIVIPIVGNVPETVTAAIVAGKNQMDLAISIALGSAIQIGLFVTPVIVLAGWALDKPMSLHFDYFGMVTLVGSVLLVSFIVLKGKTNYLQGAIMCACFAAIS
jgi:Ca2+:H+ antiporter